MASTNLNDLDILEEEDESPTGIPARIARFFSSDHTYVYLGTSVLVGIALYFMLRHECSSMGFLSQGSPLTFAVLAILGAWLVLSAAALLTKLVRWGSYDTTWAKKPQVVTVSRIFSYVVWATVLVVLIDRVILGCASMVSAAVASEKNPQDFFSSAIYMVVASKTMYIQGVTTTIGLAVFGTIIAFFLALLMCFLRIQEPTPKDNDFVKLLKTIGSGFTKTYSAVVRGTPMMVQGLIIYSAGFALFRGVLGLSVTETTGIWTYFRAGLVIISLNSTAYIMEALRGGIEAVDPGQTEAARSLGLSQWQTMLKVVFPQGIKNAIPALSNEVVVNIKDSSVLSVVGVFDLMFATTSVAGIYYRQMEVYIVAALIYLVLTFVATRLLNILSRKLGAPSGSASQSHN